MIDEGLAEPYDPEEHESGEPRTDVSLPDDLPGRDELIEAGVLNLKTAKALYEDGEFQSIDGIGPKTEHEFVEYVTKGE